MPMEPARPESLKGATVREDAPARILADEEVDSLTAERENEEEDAEETDQ